MPSGVIAAQKLSTLFSKTGSYGHGPHRSGLDAAGQPSPEIHLSLSSQHWDYNCVPLYCVIPAFK